MKNHVHWLAVVLLVIFTILFSANGVSCLAAAGYGGVSTVILLSVIALAKEWIFNKEG